MHRRKLRITGYTGHFDHEGSIAHFVPSGMSLALLLHVENGFKIEHHIDVDDTKVLQFIHFEKRGAGSGSMAGMREEL